MYFYTRKAVYLLLLPLLILYGKPAETSPRDIQRSVETYQTPEVALIDQHGDEVQFAALSWSQ